MSVLFRLISLKRGSVVVQVSHRLRVSLFGGIDHAARVTLCVVVAQFFPRWLDRRFGLVCVGNRLEAALVDHTPF